MERKELEPLVSVGVVFMSYHLILILAMIGQSFMHCNPIKDLHCIAHILYWLLMHTAYFTGVPAVSWFLQNLVGWHTEHIRDKEWRFLAIHLSREPLPDRLVFCFAHDRNAPSFKKVRDCLVLHVGQKFTVTCFSLLDFGVGTKGCEDLFFLLSYFTPHSTSSVHAWFMPFL